MNRVVVRTDGRLEDRGVVKDFDPLAYLASQVDLEEGFTLRSFFRMIEQYPVFSRLNPFLRDYMDQYRKSPPTDCLYPGVDHLELNKTVEMIGFPGEPRLEIYVSLLGMHGVEPTELKFIGIENLLDMPLKLGKLKHVILGDKVDTFEFDTVFTLFEVIDGIVYELSFHGAFKGCELRR
jgi:hypothetical protein